MTLRRITRVVQFDLAVDLVRKLKTRIAAGELGDLYLVACYQWDEQPPAPSFRTRSWGIFMGMAVHEFDQIRWVSGDAIERAAAERRWVTVEEIINP